MAKGSFQFDQDQNQLSCHGDWDVASLSHLRGLVKAVRPPQILIINGEHLQKMDTAGAWLLVDISQGWENQGVKISWENFPKQFQKLIGIVKETKAKRTTLLMPPRPNFYARVGKKTIIALLDIQQYLAFVGLLSTETLRILRSYRHLRWHALAGIIYRTGYQALPIIALLSFMIGVVIAYQMGLQLKNYGANLYIVDLLGLSILREFGPLLTAIMVAGRTGSSFTAQLGIMKMNQEIDALNTMGVTPAELLLLPRIFGLLIALPLLTMWSDIFGILGGMVMSNNMLDITWYDFLHRFPLVIKLKNLLIGLGKTPVFALIIASIGCYQGMKVKGTADSVGQNTTQSVVLSIFFIIVADAIFSIIFSKLKL